MRPRKLELENVGPFVGSVTVDFDALGDIFLISGRTGSGKTTLFDALCYALYGVLPGGRRNLSRKLRSDFADEEAECAVVLTFDLGEDSYRIERKPPRRRKKSRGEGSVEDPESALLFRVEHDLLVPLCGKKTEADELVKDLIGLSADEFCKIVLLPQGEFAEFLRQGTTERREVLRKLFPVDTAVRIRELAQERAKAAVTRLNEAERAVAERAALFDADAYAEQKAELERELAAAQTAVAQTATERERLTEVLNEAMRAEETRGRLAAAELAERTLNERDAEMRDCRSRIAASRQARPLQPLIDRATETEAAFAAATVLRDQALERDAACARESREAALNMERAPHIEREIARARELSGSLAQAAAEEEKLEADETRLRDLVNLAAESRTAVADAESVLAALDHEAAMLTAVIEERRPIEEEWERARDELERAKAVKPYAERIDRSRTEIEAARVRVANLERTIADWKNEVPLLRARLENVEEQLRHHRETAWAGTLALTLRDGAPCPVCGSIAHPAPAVSSDPSASPRTAESPATVRQSLDEALASLAASEASAAAEHARIDALEGELAEAVRQASDIMEAPGTRVAALTPPTALEATARIAAAAQALNQVLSLRTESRKARDRLDAVYREREAARSRVKTAESERNERSLQTATLRASIDERRIGIKKALDALMDGGDAATDSPRQALARLERTIAVGTTELEKLRADAATKTAEAAAAAASATECAAALETAAAARHRADDALREALTNSPFASADDARDALLPQDEEERLEAAIREWETDLRGTKALIDELKRSLAANAYASKTDYPDIESIKAALSENALRKEALDFERDRLYAASVSLEQEKQAFSAAEQRRKTLADESARIKKLADDLSGANPRKRSFDAWLLGAYLAEVASFATRRLERMSEGRYRLILEFEREGGRGQTGLDLAVFDAYTGKARPCATLSGGESFMASISLALGLADAIQSRSGGVRLDAVFIDEGFGSLDEASLDKALSILDEIRDHRMVALISHVPELRNRIPGRLDVIKSNLGSRLSVNASRA